MNALSLSALVAGATTQTSGDSGLTLGELLAGIPHDVPAFVVYAMVLGSLIFVWRAGRSRPSGTPGD